MPRAIEIYVDEKEKAVLINTNYGNREVRGATWTPRMFRLGWDAPEDISLAILADFPRLAVCCIRLSDEFGPITEAVLPRQISITMQVVTVPRKEQLA